MEPVGIEDTLKQKESNRIRTKTKPNGIKTKSTSSNQFSLESITLLHQQNESQTPLKLENGSNMNGE